MGNSAFADCSLVERVTLPLKEDVITTDDVFRFCAKLSRVDLVEIEVLNETIAALLIDKWRDDMSEEIDSINQSLPNAPAGSFLAEEGDKTSFIRQWMGRVLHKIVGYKAQHRRILEEAASTLQHLLPNDIVTNNIMPFLELPSHTFEGEIGVEDTTGMLNRSSLTE